MKTATATALGLLGYIASGTAQCQATNKTLEARCAHLASSLSIDNTTVWFTESISQGSNLSLAENDATCSTSSQIIATDLCRVAMRVTTSPTSEISLEAWLPFNWTGRFLSTGNGGLNGCINYGHMAYTSGLGFATVGANNGHNGTRGFDFANNTEVVEDYAYRSMHTGVVVGKQVSEAFYGKSHDKSYYLGCSTGGRQGFKEAQEFPDDFDGIVAGAPAMSFNNLTAWSGHFFGITGAPGDDTFLETSEWQMVFEDVMAQCDGLDGALDGVLEDPDVCQYRPEALICAANQTSGCLTGTQAATVRQVFEPLYGEDGSFVYPRMQPGISSTTYFRGSMFTYTSDWYDYVLNYNVDWSTYKLTPADYTAIWQANPFDISTWKGDLSGVRDRGTKILHYHGLADAIIASENSPRYYNHVARTMGLSEGEIDEFYRYFKIAGMGHCRGGEGPTSIGNEEGTSFTTNPEGNVLMAMVRWVEEGVAPETVTGAAVDSTTGDVLYTRRHCKYPRRNVFKGTDYTNPDHWECI